MDANAFEKRINEIWSSEEELSSYGNVELFKEIQKLYESKKSRLILDKNYLGRGIFFKDSINKKMKLLYKFYEAELLKFDLEKEYPIIMFSKVASLIGFDATFSDENCFIITNKTLYYNGYKSLGLLETETIHGAIPLKNIKNFSLKKNITDHLEITINGIPTIVVEVADDMMKKEQKSLSNIFDKIVRLAPSLGGVASSFSEDDVSKNNADKKTLHQDVERNGTTLKEEAIQWTKKGYIIENQSSDFLQMKKPKTFSWIAAILWLILTAGPGVFVYFIYHAFIKKEPRMIFQVDSSGIVSGSKVG